MSVFFYILAIIAANIVTARFGPAHLGPFLVPMGSYLIGFVLITRNLVQMRYGRYNVYLAILAGLILSAISSHLLGDSVMITVASAIAFVASESADTETFTRLRLPTTWRVWWGGVVGGVLDSVVFVVIGLSPLGAGFVPWVAIPMAIAGQLIVKVVMQAIGAVIIGRWRDGIS